MGMTLIAMINSNQYYPDSTKDHCDDGDNADDDYAEW